MRLTLKRMLWLAQLVAVVASVYAAAVVLFSLERLAR